MKRTTTGRGTRLAAIGGVVALLAGVGAATAATKTTVAAPSITSAPATTTAQPTATFAFTGPAKATFRCRVDAAAFAACTSPVTYAGLADGGHTFSVKAVVGTDESTVTTYSWAIDRTPAAPVLTGKPADPTSNATNVFTWSTTSGLTYQCSLENGAWSTCSSPFTWVIRTDNYGQHQFAVRAVDSAGRTSAATAYTFKYQKGLPDQGVPFTISGTVDDLVLGVPRAVSVKVTNPNPVAIYVQGVTVSVDGTKDSPSCRSDANLQLTQSNVSPTRTLLVPANGSVTLPAQGASAPTLLLKNLPTVNQDGCKGATFALRYSGTATN